MNVVYADEFLKTLERLKKRDHNLFLHVQKKINQIALLDGGAIEHFKNLRGSMSNLKRVHIGSFVLTFQLLDGRIVFEALEHHDDAY